MRYPLTLVILLLKKSRTCHIFVANFKTKKIMNESKPYKLREQSCYELDSFVANMPKDVLQMASEYAIKESRAGRGIPHAQAMEMIKAKRGWK